MEGQGRSWCSAAVAHAQDGLTLSQTRCCSNIHATASAAAAPPSTAGLPPSDSLLSMPSAPSLGPADVSTVAAAAEGTTAPASWADDGMLSTAPSSPPLSPRRPPSRLRRVFSGNASRNSGSVEGSRHGSSREGSRHGGGAALLELGVPLATPEQQAAEEGVQATAGAIAVAGIEVAAEALEELEQGAAVATPAGSGEPGAPAGVAAGAHPPAPFEGPRWVQCLHALQKPRVPMPADQLAVAVFFQGCSLQQL